MEVMNCPSLAVPNVVMQHVVAVESSFNRYAIGVVGGRLVRQPRTLAEAIATARMLAARGYNFSLGLAQVNRHNLGRFGLDTYAKAFGTCANVQAGARILGNCLTHARDDWGKALSCYYSGNFTTGFRDGYVAKVFASMRTDADAAGVAPIALTRWAAVPHTAQDAVAARTEREPATPPSVPEGAPPIERPARDRATDAPSAVGGASTGPVSRADPAFVF